MSLPQQVDPAHGQQAFPWARAATIMAVVMSAGFCIAKAIGWYMTGSAAVLGSLADSALDLLGSLAAAAAVRYAELPPDDNHRFGHKKAEALVALAQVALIAGSVTLVTWESTHRLVSPDPIQNAPVAVWVLSSTLIGTMLLVAFQSIALKKSNSLIIAGDRAHYLGDLFGNAAAVVAVVLSAHYGLLRADAAAGLIAALLLAIAGWKVWRAAVSELMDEELSEADKDVIRQLLNQDPDVKDFHAMRTRRAGSRRFIQVDIQIDADLSFRQAHAISDRVELALEEAFPDADVIVHADPLGEARLERRAVESA